jgi:arginyl-tRNA synthetase
MLRPTSRLFGTASGIYTQIGSSMSSARRKASTSKWCWRPAVHVKIGSVLGADHKILRTRSGDSVRLLSLLDDAVEQARSQLEGRADRDPADRIRIAEEIGIAAVKYADLSVAHDTDYVFDAQKMVATNGNTGPYLQYASARIRSIFRNLNIDPEEATPPVPVVLNNASERELVLDLLGYGTVVAAVGTSYEPHALCAYLFRLAQDFSRFYEESPITRAEPVVQQSRLQISKTALAILVHGMGLLGIVAPERM